MTPTAPERIHKISGHFFLLGPDSQASSDQKKKKGRVNIIKYLFFIYTELVNVIYIHSPLIRAVFNILIYINLIKFNKVA